MGHACINQHRASNVCPIVPDNLNVKPRPDGLQRGYPAAPKKLKLSSYPIDFKKNMGLFWDRKP